MRTTSVRAIGSFAVVVAGLLVWLYSISESHPPPQIPGGGAAAMAH